MELWSTALVVAGLIGLAVALRWSIGRMSEAAYAMGYLQALNGDPPEPHHAGGWLMELDELHQQQQKEGHRHG